MDRRSFLLSAAAALAASAVSGGDVLAQARALVDGGASRKPAAQKARRQVVAIDAGHGGKDSGAMGVRGSQEKDVTLAVAQELARRLEATGRYEPVLVRPNDVFIPLHERVRIARSRAPALFMSLHADYVDNPERRGFSVYTLADTASDNFAAALADSQNAADRYAGLSLSSQNKQVRAILIDLLARETINNSTLMADTLVETLSAHVPPLQRPHRQANFAVLRAPDVPSVLVEMGFMSNLEDEKQLVQRSYQGRLAERLHKSIDNYFRAA